MNFRGHTSSSKNLKQKSHQACTVWKKFGIYLLQCVKTCDFLFFHSPSPMIWSCFFLLFIFSTIYHFSFSTFRWVKSLLHRNFILLMFQSWKLFFMRQHSRISIFILPCFPPPLIHRHSYIIILSRLERFLLRECQIHASALALRTKKNCLIR